MSDSDTSKSTEALAFALLLLGLFILMVAAGRAPPGRRRFAAGAMIASVVAMSLSSCALFDEPLPSDATDTSLVGAGDQIFYQHTARLDTVALVTDEAGEVVSRRAASPFGVKTGHDGQDSDEFSFTGKEWDDATGYVYFGARYFDPSLGRWISPDPLGLWEPGLPMGDRNLMTYVGNAPTSHADPNGLCRGLWSMVSSAACELEKPAASQFDYPLSAVEKRDYETSRKVGTSINRTGKKAAAVTVTAIGASMIAGGAVAEAGPAATYIWATNHQLALGEAAIAAFEIGSGFEGESVFVGTAYAGIVAVGSNLSKVDARLVDDLAEAGQDVWKLPPFIRGFVIEDVLGQNLAHPYKTFDRFIGGVATSIKSMDLNAVTYVDNPRQVYSTLKYYIDEIAEFSKYEMKDVRITRTGKKANVSESVLELAVPAGSGNAAQMEAIGDAAAYAEELGVQIKIVEIK